MLQIFAIILILISSLAHAPIAAAQQEDTSKTVILAYHRINEPQSPQSNLSLEQFKSHIEEIKSSDYNVIPLPALIKALQSEHSLPPRTIAITFEGGYRSAYTYAMPLLIENNIPFTVIIPTGRTDIPNHLDWKTIKKLSKYKHVTFGILPDDYAHITHLPKQEITRTINKARIAFKKHMGFEAKILSYPFGEISPDLKSIANAQGFDAALGLQSGPAHAGSNILALPRFTMSGHYGDLDRFRMVTNTAPLFVSDVEPAQTFVTQPITQIGFTTPASTEDEIKNISCHISNQRKPKVEFLGNRVEIIPAEPITGERTRINCTLPNHKAQEKQWRWFGMLFHGD